MQCYKCSKAGMEKKLFQGLVVDRCPICEGLWLDGGEIEMLQHHDEKSPEELHIEAREEIKSEKRRICPSCNGMYFDWGELTKVLKATETKGFMALIDKIREALTS